MNCLTLGIALTLHIGLQDDYNNMHPYLMCEKNQIITGLYYNSLNKVSVVLAKEYDLTDDVKLDVGLATGYVLYDIFPMFRVKYKNFFVMPALEGDKIGLTIGTQF